MGQQSTETRGLAGNVIEPITGQGSLKNVIALQLRLHPASPAAPCTGNKFCVAPAVATADRSPASPVNTIAAKQKNQTPFTLASVSPARPPCEGTYRPELCVPLGAPLKAALWG